MMRTGDLAEPPGGAGRRTAIEFRALLGRAGPGDGQRLADPNIADRSAILPTSDLPARLDAVEHVMAADQTPIRRSPQIAGWTDGRNGALPEQLGPEAHHLARIEVQGHVVDARRRP